MAVQSELVEWADADGRKHVGSRNGSAYKKHVAAAQHAAPTPDAAEVDADKVDEDKPADDGPAAQDNPVAEDKPAAVKARPASSKAAAGD